jgi:uncharacterized protein YdeI (YjbR/CyaY-like superfamily)
MDPGKTVYVTNREGFRNWLEKNGGNAKEIWLVIFKDASGVETLTYEQAVEEALCFGWTEGQGKPIDDEKHVQRFTPRPPDAPWTEAELERVRALVAEGRMNEAGMATLPSDFD